ncbi:MAG TPA: DUF58 domain-containing protein [Armatimonadetes bacterium]|jgi:uncharacterized protein (DUF58 family)|nr:DUF58 domain-containing protein [Armatimonadota bacterium]
MSAVDPKPTTPPGKPGAGLLEPGFLAKLERLALVSRRVYAGQIKGERRSTRRGGSVEFADFRDYVPGDDLRQIDWNTFARLERLFLKLFVEEEDLTVHLLIDGSRSMAFGAPPKGDYARRVAAALGFIGLSGLDRVTAAVLTEEGANTMPVVRGRPQVFQLFGFLEEARFAGRTNLARSLHDYALRSARPGLAVLISDCLDPGYAEGLKALAARRFDVAVLHLLDSTEMAPELAGDLKLVDAETGEIREISVSQHLLGQYRKALEEFCADLSRVCARYGMEYIRATTDVPFEELVLRTLRGAGVLR